MFYSNLDYLAKIEDGPEAEFILKEALKEKKIVDAFCKMFECRLVAINRSRELGKLEPVYLFDDGNEYTRAGLENCFKE